MRVDTRISAIAVALLLVVLSACGNGADTVRVGNAVDRNGVLNAAYVLPPIPMDPHRTTSDTTQFTYSSLVYDRLTKIEPGPKVAPMLATSWEFAGDGMSVTFALRGDVTFSDGVTLDADAVKASLDRAVFDPRSTVSFRFPMIVSVDVVDPTTIRIDTNRKAADLPYLLAGSAGSIVSPKALNNPDLDVAPVGSGPYLLTKIKLGGSASFERRDGYWNPEDAPAKTINISGIPDNNARSNALRSGEVDLILAKSTQAQLVQGLGAGFSLYTYPPGASYSLFLNRTVPPLDDVKVRQALNYAVDRRSIADNLLDGYCEPLDQPLPSSIPGHVAAPPVDYPHDPAKAKVLLAEAGHPDGFSVRTLVGAGSEPQASIATAVQAQLAEIGVKLEIVTKDAAQTPSIYEQGGYGGYLQTRVAGPIPLVTFSTNYLSPRYFPGPVPEGFQQALTAASDPELDQAAATAALERASSVANEQAFDAFICAYSTQVAFSDHVTGADGMGTAYYSGVFDLRKVSVLGS